MLGELVPVGGGDPVPLLRARLLVGRRSRCDICLDYPNISSQHCELELEAGYWQVRDLRSTNGVKVNGQPVEVQVLMPGDTLTIAKLDFEIVYQANPDVPPPQAEDEDLFSTSLLEKAGLEGQRRARRRSRRRDREAPAKPPQPQIRDDLSSEDAQIQGWLTEDDLSGE
jgi:predicted component of type VI protein secretion system